MNNVQHRQVSVVKRLPDGVITESEEAVGEQPLDDEIFSLMRSAQNRQHGLSLEIKRMHRVLDRVKDIVKEIARMKSIIAEREETIEQQSLQIESLKAWKREHELEDMRAQ